MPDAAELEEMIYRSVRSVGKVQATDLNLDAALFGQPGALLDSFSLVQLIFELERNIRQTTNREIKFTMQQLLSEKNNPFHSVRNLLAFLSKTLNEPPHA